ncbi:hypothetical protein C0J45_23232, partial [Silurus meridionalis]
IFLYIFFFIAGSFADKIWPTHEDANIVGKETETVTLKCSYETSSENIELFWYKQYPNRAPQFLLYKAARLYSDGSTPTDTRLETKTTRDSTELTIRATSLDKALIVGDFNIHFDNQEDSLRAAVVSILDSVGINQNVMGPTHSGGHTLDLLLTFGLKIKNLVIIPQSEAISDHYLISFKICLSHCISTSPHSIKPLFTHKAVDEGDDVTLSCNYETSDTGPVLHWYRQQPKSKPVFLLYIDLFGGKTKPMPPRLDAEVDKTNKEVDLIISSAAVSDSDLYYCALRPTVTGNPAALYKNLYTLYSAKILDCNSISADLGLVTSMNFLSSRKKFDRLQKYVFCDSTADPIEPLFTQKVVDEGENVTLSCSYTKFSGTVDYLQWYRHYPTSQPEFLLYINPNGFKTNPMPPHLDVEVDKTKKQVDLIISSAAVSDSDLYYCALVPTVTGNPAALYKNL